MRVTWDLTHFFKTEEEALKLEDKINVLLNSFLDKMDSFFLDDEAFLEGIESSLKINEYLEQVYCYYKRHIDLNQNDDHMKNNFNRAISLYQKIDSINKTFHNKISIEQEKIKKFLENAKFKKHRLYIERILEENRYCLTDEKIKMIKNVKQITSAIPMMYRNIIERNIVYKKVKDESGNLKEARKTFVSNDRNVRKKSYIASRNSLFKVNSLVSGLYDMKIGEEILLSSIQGFEDPADKNAIENELPLTIRRRLLDKIVSHASISHRYSSLRKKISKLDSFYTYDFSTPFLQQNKKYELNEALFYIKEALKPLGVEYLKKIEQAFLEGWVDVYPKEGKRFDSASMICYAAVPYAILNYRDDFHSMRCLIHELGHSIHSSYAKEKNDFEYFEYNLFIAEITSAVNEQLLFDYLKNHADSEEVKCILKEMVSYYQNGIFYQTILSLFEEEMYQKKKEGVILNETVFNESYLKHQRLIYGDDVILQKEDSYDWIIVPQFLLNQPFYIWKYSLDKCIALYIFKRLKEDSSYLDKYLTFLRAGNSMKTEELLKIIDIDLNDLSFVDAALKEYDLLLEEFEKIMN